jgi:hypothetical protein
LALPPKSPFARGRDGSARDYFSISRQKAPGAFCAKTLGARLALPPKAEARADVSTVPEMSFPAHAEQEPARQAYGSVKKPAPSSSSAWMK